MNEYVSAKIDGKRAGFNIRIDAQSNDGTRLFLLKEKQDAGGYDYIIEITSGHKVKHDNLRDQLGFEFATLDSYFANRFARTSAIAYGKPDADDAMDVFAVSERDKLPPDGKSPTYKCFGNRIENERWIIPFADGGVIFPPEPPEPLPPEP